MTVFAQDSFGEDVRKRVSLLSEEIYKKAKDLLLTNYEMVEVLSKKLLEVKTMSGEETKAIIAKCND